MSAVRGLLPTTSDLRAMTREPRRDLLAGLTVAIVALPLALGFGVASGLGAEAGLVTAIVAGALAAIFGGSNLQVSGPTGAMTVVLLPIVAQHGPGGVLAVGLLAGLMLVGLALLRAGRGMRYVPLPVVEGFTLGIALVIALQQVPSALGVPVPEGERVVAVAWSAVQDFAGAPDWTAPGIALGVAVVMLVGARLRPGVPFSILAVAAATLVAEFTPISADPIGDLPAGLPAPSLDFLELSALSSLLAPAVAVAALAALESLLSATVADGMTTGQRHDPDRELFGQGVANLAVPLFGGVPATAAIARTAVNVRSGASSRLAALSHAVILAVVVLAAAPLVSKVPLAALAGVLLATAVRMAELGTVRMLARASRADGAVLVLTCVATLALDLVQAVLLGLAVSGVLALRAIARQAGLEHMPLSPDRTPTPAATPDVPAEVGQGHQHRQGRGSGRGRGLDLDRDGDLDRERDLALAEHIAVYRLRGPLFFAAADRFVRELADVPQVRVLVVRMSVVSVVDTTGATLLADALNELRQRGVTVLVSGVREEQRGMFDVLGVLDEVRAAGREFATFEEALTAARQLVREGGPLPAQAVAPLGKEIVR